MKDSELTSYDPLTVTRLPPCQPNHEDDTGLGQERTHHDLEPLQERGDSDETSRRTRYRGRKGQGLQLPRGQGWSVLQSACS